VDSNRKNISVESSSVLLMTQSPEPVKNQICTLFTLHARCVVLLRFQRYSYKGELAPTLKHMSSF
jgi:hypothetical protein